MHYLPFLAEAPDTIQTLFSGEISLNRKYSKSEKDCVQLDLPSNISKILLNLGGGNLADYLHPPKWRVKSLSITKISGLAIPKPETNIKQLKNKCTELSVWKFATCNSIDDSPIPIRNYLKIHKETILWILNYVKPFQIDTRDLKSTTTIFCRNLLLKIRPKQNITKWNLNSLKIIVAKFHTNSIRIPFWNICTGASVKNCFLEKWISKFQILFT